MSSSTLPQSILQDRRLYEILCIENFSSVEEVRVAYKALALKNHPDKNIGDPSAADRFREISRAYEVLANPEHKKRYDVALRVALASSGRGGASSSQLGPNLYSANSVSTSDIYKDLYRRQTERAATRSRTTSQPPKDPQKTTSQYTKAQQELFRKRERERQQELFKQMEKEKKEQRERERAALRKEQERQEELLQRRWQQQQQQQQQRSFAPRMATRTTGTKRTSSTGTGGGGTGSARYAAANNNSSARGVDGSSRTVTPRSTATASSAAAAGGVDGGQSGRRTPAATPNTVRVNTPARNVTPRVRRGATSTPSPGRRSNDRFGWTTPTTPTPTSMNKDEDEDEDDFARRASREAEGESSGPCTNGDGWFTPPTSPMEGNVHALRTSTIHISSSSSGDDDDDAISSINPQPAPNMGFTGAEKCGATSTTTTATTTAESSILQRTQRRQTSAATRPSATGEHQHAGPNGKGKEDRASARKASPSSYSSHCSLSNSGVAARTHSPRTPTITTMHNGSSSGKTRATTPRGLTSAYPTRATSPSASSPRSTAGGIGGASPSSSRSPATAARTTSPLPGSKAAASGSSPALQRARVIPGLAASDKELLEKQRRERMAKEKERQRAVRLAEEERQFRRAARAMKEQKAADGAAAEDEARLSMEQLLQYVQSDEASERQQFIEREEQLAWRRLQRQHITVLAESVFRRRFAALTMEEVVRRNGISSAARRESFRLGCLFQEWCERCNVEWREGRDRRQLKGREAAGSYHAQRLFQRRSVLLAEEAAQRCSVKGDALQTWAVLRHCEEECRYRTTISLEEAATRRLLLTHFMAETSRQARRESSQRTDEAAAAAAVAESPLHQHADVRQQGGERGDAKSNGSDERHPPRASSPSADGTRGEDDHHNHNNASFLYSRRCGSADAPHTNIALVVPLAEASTGASFYTPYSKGSPVNTTLSTAATAAATMAGAKTKDEQCGSGAAAQAGERRVQLLLADEARQRSFLITQQHYEEVALRRRRANAAHRAFVKEKEEAVKAAQRAAQDEIRAMQAELRLLQRQQCASTASIPPLNDNGAAAAASVPRAARTQPSASEDTTPTKPVVTASTQQLMAAAAAAAATGVGDDGGRQAEVSGVSTTRDASLSAPAAPRRRHVVSTLGWKALPDSDVEDNDDHRR